MNIRKNLKALKWIGILLFVLGILLMINMGIYAFQHPTLTHTQVFIEKWPWGLAGTLLSSCGSCLVSIARDLQD